jgi:hypothetical protein
LQKFTGQVRGFICKKIEPSLDEEDPRMEI